VKLTNNKSRPIVNVPAYYLGRPNSMYFDRYTTATALDTNRRVVDRDLVQR
jgi:hypothetical protein